MKWFFMVMVTVIAALAIGVTFWFVDVAARSGVIDPEIVGNARCVICGTVAAVWGALMFDLATNRT